MFPITLRWLFYYSVVPSSGLYIIDSFTISNTSLLIKTKLIATE